MVLRSLDDTRALARQIVEDTSAGARAYATEGPQFGRVSPAGRTVMLRLAGAPEHLAER